MKTKWESTSALPALQKSSRKKSRRRSLLTTAFCRVLFTWAITALVLSGFGVAKGQPSSSPATPTVKFDPESASRAYLDRLPPEKKARSDAYFEGGYWLQLWEFLYASGLAILLLQMRLSAGMRNLACRMTRFKPLQTAIYAVQYIVLVSVLTFPLTVYSDFFREHQYGMANQNFGGWLGDWSKGLLVNVVLSTLLMMALFGIVRRLLRTWHLWGSVVSLAFLVLTIVIGPVFIAPLFNKYTLL